MYLFRCTWDLVDIIDLLSINPSIKIYDEEWKPTQIQRGETKTSYQFSEIYEYTCSQIRIYPKISSRMWILFCIPSIVSDAGIHKKKGEKVTFDLKQKVAGETILIPRIKVLEKCFILSSAFLYRFYCFIYCSLVQNTCLILHHVSELLTFIMFQTSFSEVKIYK